MQQRHSPPPHPFPSPAPDQTELYFQIIKMKSMIPLRVGCAILILPVPYHCLLFHFSAIYIILITPSYTGRINVVELCRRLRCIALSILWPFGLLPQQPLESILFEGCLLGKTCRKNAKAVCVDLNYTIMKVTVRTW